MTAQKSIADKQVHIAAALVVALNTNSCCYKQTLELLTTVHRIAPVSV